MTMKMNGEISPWGEMKLYGGIGSSESMGRVVGGGREKLKVEAILPPAGVRAASWLGSGPVTCRHLDLGTHLELTASEFRERC